MNRTVVISGHPDLENSNTNTIILDCLKSRLPNTEIRRLDLLYPDFNVDVQAEQEALLKADIIVLQFPFYWYSVPALLKKWIDEVFAYGFAYGSEGTKLKGKKLILSFTIGGPKDSYNPLGYNHFPVEQLLQPLQQTAFLSGLDYIEPVYTYGMVYIPGVYNTLEEVQEKAKSHSESLIKRISEIEVFGMENNQAVNA